MQQHEQALNPWKYDKYLFQMILTYCMHCLYEFQH